MFVRSLASTITALLAVNAQANIEEFINAQAWQSATDGGFSTINFTEFADTTPISSQYASVGVTFSGFAFILETAGAVNDGFGLHGPSGLSITFATPQNWIAVDYPGAIKFDLYSSGSLIYSSAFFQPGGLGNFAGLVSSMPFDHAYLYRPAPFANNVFIDDLHWGAPVPGPGTLVIVALGVLPVRGRRRT